MSVQVNRRTALACLLPLALAGGDAPPGVLPEPPPPWPGETRLVRGARSLILAHQPPATGAAALRELARRADVAAARVGAVLRRTVRPVVLVPASAAEAARLAGTGPLDGLAAVADDDRVIVVPGGFDRLTPTGRDVVLAHELTHVAAGTGGLPVWLYEGFADYVAYRDAGLPVRVAAAELAAEVRSGRAPRELPGPAAFAPGAHRLAAAYQEAWLACRFIAARTGETRLVRLYREARAVGADRALSALGLPVTTLTALWRAYVRDELS
ncbi:hypothetical protein [Nonomuraea indica]|uniref:hypothetical protein n=1 Tax=Nonomuraea indica TaxID=1581193 RepID=UPI001182983F|nr:hypothetical protein [Nonomuraea indica]